MAAAVLAILLFAPALPLVVGDDYDRTAPLLTALSPLILLRALSLFPMNALLGLGRYGLRFVAIFSCTLLNVTLNGVLIWQFSVAGAVAATLLTDVVFVVVAWCCVASAQHRQDRQHVLRGHETVGGSSHDAGTGTVAR